MAGAVGKRLQGLSATRFDLEQLIVDCRAALRQDASHSSVREVVARAVSNPAAVLRALGEPRRGEIAAGADQGSVF